MHNGHTLYPPAKGSCHTTKRRPRISEEFWLATSIEQEISAEVEAPASVMIKKEGNVIQVKGHTWHGKEGFHEASSHSEHTGQ